MKKWIWLTVLVALIPGVVSADELWVKNEGGLEITVWSDSDWQDVTVSGGVDVSNATDAPEGSTSLVAVGPGFTPKDGEAKVAAVTLESGWVVIEADDITGYNIEVACNQAGEDIIPQSYIVKDAPLDAPQVADLDGGQSVKGMNDAAFLASVSIGPDSPWYWT
jgi:hypothetical protein